jgi:ABC-2 type transport system permease protein
MHADHAVRPVRGRGAPAHLAGSTARLAWHRFRDDLRAFFRGRQARFFTLALPVLFLVIFASVFTGTAKVAGGPIDTSVYYVPGNITLAIISAAFGNPVRVPDPYFYTLEVV